MSDEKQTQPAKLTHNMIRVHRTTWRCVDCQLAGTIAQINAHPCSKDTDPAEANVLSAIAGEGKFR